MEPMHELPTFGRKISEESLRNHNQLPRNLVKIKISSSFLLDINIDHHTLNFTASSVGKQSINMNDLPARDTLTPAGDQIGGVLL